MNKIFLFWFIILPFFALSQAKNGFYENKGQIINQDKHPNSDIRYLLNTKGLNVQLKNDGFSYDVYEQQITDELYQNNLYTNDSILVGYNYKQVYHRVDFTFLNSNSKVTIVPFEKLQDFDHFYNINHQPNGVTFVSRYKKIVYKNLYNKIDLEFYIPENQQKPVEYNFVIHQGGNIDDIKMKIDGAESKLVENEIIMNLSFGEMIETIPLSWVERKDENEILKITYKELSDNVYGFELPKMYKDINDKIIIDPTPVRKWATYYSGENSSNHNLVTTDNLGFVYISGSTTSTTNIATSGTHQSVFTGTSSQFFAKLNSSGERIWGTYHSVGGQAMIIDNQYNLIVCGGVNNSVPNFTDSNSYQQNFSGGNSEAHLYKFNALGVRQWATYYGGEGGENFTDIKIDNNNNIYVIGSTYSNNNITSPGAYLETRDSEFNSGNTAFVIKFNPNGHRIWGTYYYKIGSPSQSDFRTFDFDLSGNLVLSGYAYNQEDFPTNRCIVTFDVNGQMLDEYFYDGPTGFVSKIVGNYYYIGLQNGISPNYQVIKKYDLLNKQFLWSYDVQGSAVRGFGVNSQGEIFYSGRAGQNFNVGIATPGSFMPIKPNNSDKAFLIKLNTNGQKEWGTYYGGNEEETYCRLAIGFQDEIYLYGTTHSDQGISTSGAYQEVRGSGDWHSYLVKFEGCESEAEITEYGNFCIGSDLQLTASGGTNYLWTGPNNFVSTEQNPIIPTATIDNEGFYTCYISGGLTCYGYFQTYLQASTNSGLPPIPVLENLPPINALCEITITDFPKAIDSCGNQVEATTNNLLHYNQEGSYTITWIYTDISGNSIEQTQLIIVEGFGDFLPTPVYKLCSLDGEPVEFNLSSAEGYLFESQAQLCYKYFLTYEDLIQNQNSIDDLEHYLIQENTIIYVKIFDCDNASCFVDTLFTIGLEIVPTIVADLPNIENCKGEYIDLQEVTYYIHQEFQTYNFNISYFNSVENAISNQNSLPLNYQTNSNETIYVRVNSSQIADCFSLTSFEVIAKDFPHLTSISDIYNICEGEMLQISILEGFDSYLWSDGSIDTNFYTNDGGNYWVIVTQNNCSATYNFEVIESSAPIISEINVVDFSLNNNSIEVGVYGIGDYEYSLNGLIYQDSPLFENVDSGTYLVTVKDKNGCGVDSKYVTVLMYPTFFTPNGDGFNDFWQIKYAFVEPNMQLFIFDRFGKLIHFFKGRDRGWDGTYNGKKLPSTDYWFIIKRESGQEIKGHFSMVR